MPCTSLQSLDYFYSCCRLGPKDELGRRRVKRYFLRLLLLAAATAAAATTMMMIMMMMMTTMMMITSPLPALQPGVCAMDLNPPSSTLDPFPKPKPLLPGPQTLNPKPPRPGLRYIGPEAGGCHLRMHPHRGVVVQGLDGLSEEGL